MYKVFCHNTAEAGKSDFLVYFHYACARQFCSQEIFSKIEVVTVLLPCFLLRTGYKSTCESGGCPGWTDLALVGAGSKGSVERGSEQGPHTKWKDVCGGGGGDPGKEPLHGNVWPGLLLRLWPA